MKNRLNNVSFPGGKAIAGQTLRCRQRVKDIGFVPVPPTIETILTDTLRECG